MADIEITETHSRTMDAVKAIIEKAMPAYSEKYGVTCDWATPECLAFTSSKGVVGTVLIDSDKVTIEANLSGFFLRTFTPLIRSGMASEMNALLNSEPV